MLGFGVLVELAVASNWISPLFVARPSAALATLVDELINGNYATLLLATLAETAAAFLAATAIGLSLGYLLWRNGTFGEAYEPLLLALFASPTVLLYPVFLVMLQRSPSAVVAQGFLAGLLPILITTRRAFLQVDPTYLKVARVLRLSPPNTFREVLLPAAMPGIIAGLRLGLTYTLLTVLAMEYVTSLGGIGSAISDAYSRLRAPELYAALFLVIALSVLFLFTLERFERAVLRRR